ncbi:MAG: PAS domain-containing sensor histidine kinase [Bacteroidota bacterium]
MIISAWGSSEGLSDKQKNFLQEISNYFNHLNEKQKLLEMKLQSGFAEQMQLQSMIKKESEDKLHAAENYNFLLNTISDTVLSVDLINNKVMQISSACSRIYGYSEDDFISGLKFWKTIVNKEDLNSLEEFLHQVCTGNCHIHETRINHADGSKKWISINVELICEKNGKPFRADVIISDITDKKSAERKESETESKYRDLFEKTVDGIYKSSHQGKFLEVNPAVVKMLGYSSKEELMSIDIKASLYFETSERDNAVMQDKAEGISVFRLRKKDGSEIWVEDRGQYVTDSNGQILYHEGILRDVTKRVQAEFLLSKSEKETADYRKALDQSLIVSIIDDKGMITYVNENFVHISHYSTKELLSKHHLFLNAYHHSDEFNAEIWSTIQRGEVWRGELKNRTKQGSSYWTETTVVPFLNTDGTPYQFLSLSVDITERKKTQEDIIRKNEELQKTNAELDKFVYSISHDLRAPICSIQGIINVSLEETTDPYTRESLQLIESGANRLDVLIHDILDYSSNARTALIREAIDFKELFDDIIMSGKCISIKNKKIDTRLICDNSCNFLGDKKRIVTILKNLISNGMMYHDPLKKNPYVQVSVCVTEMDVVIEVEDNGIGINEKDIDKIFEMFYRISENSIGSGLGLYIVNETVSKLNGRIDVQSERGKGSLFTLHLPNYIMYN